MKSIIVLVMSLCVGACASTSHRVDSPTEVKVSFHPTPEEEASFPTPAPTCAPDACPLPTQEPEGAAPDPRASTDPILAPIAFKEGSAILTHNDEQVLNMVAAHLVESYVSSDVRIRVEGMAPDAALAKARAREVVKYLVRQGVPIGSLIRTSRTGVYNRVQFVPYVEQ